MQKPNEDPLAVVCSRGEIDLSFWSRSASRILLSENGLYRFKPHEDRWEDEKTRGFDLVWDQISGKA